MNNRFLSFGEPINKCILYFLEEIRYNRIGDVMRTLGSFIVMILAVILFLVAMPYLWILLLIMIGVIFYLYYKSKKVMNQAQKDIHNVWNGPEYDDSVESRKNSDVIDVEYEERDIEDK